MSFGIPEGSGGSSRTKTPKSISRVDKKLARALQARASEGARSLRPAERGDTLTRRLVEGNATKLRVDLSKLVRRGRH